MTIESCFSPEISSAIQLASSTRAAVMLRGEAGTEKDRIAAVIHHESARSKKPFIQFSFAESTHAEELESELWGGLFELAHQGTLFLDDIEKAPLPTQAKLLRVLEERQFRKPGNGPMVSVDIRFISATPLNLEAEVRKGRFLEDLYYRLNVIPIFLPPLRQRKGDFPRLIDQFLERFNQENSKNIKDITGSALTYLTNYSWPGNIPEFENVLERACVLCKKGTLTLDLFLELGLPRTTNIVSGDPLEPVPEKINLPEAVETMEKQMIKEAMSKTGGIQKRASELLGITERMLGYKLKIYDLKETLLHHIPRVQEKVSPA